MTSTRSTTKLLRELYEAVWREASLERGTASLALDRYEAQLGRLEELGKSDPEAAAAFVLVEGSNQHREYAAVSALIAGCFHQANSVRARAKARGDANANDGDDEEGRAAAKAKRDELFRLFLDFTTAHEHPGLRAVAESALALCFGKPQPPRARGV